MSSIANYQFSTEQKETLKNGFSQMVQCVTKAITDGIIANLDKTKSLKVIYSDAKADAVTPPPSIVVQHSEEKETVTPAKKAKNAPPVKLIDMEDSQNPKENWIQRPAEKKKTPVTPRVPNSGYTSSSSSEDELEVVKEKSKTPKRTSKSKTLKKNTPKKKVVDSSSDDEDELSFDDDEDLIKSPPKKTDVLELNKTLGLKQMKDFYFEAFMRNASGRFANDIKWLIKKTAPQLYAVFRQRGGKELEHDDANNIAFVSKELATLTSKKRTSHRSLATELGNFPSKKPKMKHTAVKHVLTEDTPISKMKANPEPQWQMYVATLKNKWEQSYSSIPMPTSLNSPFLNLVAAGLPEEIKRMREGMDQASYTKFLSD